MEIEPDDTGALFHLGCLLTALDRPDEAVPVFLKATVLSPLKPALKLALAVAVKDSGDLDEAGRLYRSVVDSVPSLADTHTDLGIALPLQPRLEEALEAYRTVMTRQPDLFLKTL